MNFNSNLESFKNKRDLVDELDYYKSIILKKVKNGDYKSALEKVRSALILLEEHQRYFNIEKELHDFYKLNKNIKDELMNHRMIYERRFNNLLREKLSEANLEHFSKLLAMFKNDSIEFKAVEMDIPSKQLIEMPEPEMTSVVQTVTPWSPDDTE